MVKKVAWILIDGVGDIQIPEFDNRTPLEAADTPFLDALAECGMNGLMDPVETGLACGSDTAHLNLFGYDPRVYYRGRGAFESMGSGLDMEPGDIAFKSNFATLDPATNVVLLRRADRNFEEIGPILCAALNGIKLPNFPDVEVAVKYATEHRCAVRIRGPNLSDQITGTDPLVDNLPLIRSEAFDPANPAAVRTAAVVNELSAAIQAALTAHPINAARVQAGKNVANLVLLRGPGERLRVCRCHRVPSFAERHGGIRAFMIAPTAIIAGVGMTLGMDLIKVPGASGDYHSNYTAKAQAFCHALEGLPPLPAWRAEADEGPHQMGFLHLKGIDDSSHDGNPALKTALARATSRESNFSSPPGIETPALQRDRRELIERADRMLGLVLNRLQDGPHDVTVFVLGDHSTPCCVKDHSCEPVPVLVCPLASFKRRYRAVAALQLLSHTRDLPAAHYPPLPAAPDQAAESDRARHVLHHQLASWTDGVVRYGERYAHAGRLGRFPGSEIMRMVEAVLLD
ncbi:putative bisphosphoglycerate-independent phosphoglycerate mutase [Paratrimastix pyriformis]|uniref:Bisphosphoglycerate-independent phosphoglycerate mutase n=1 Tax=Paratrimastix pyriformis TaxID=342808 RepID=A0ABQ8UQJ3_9EUKA|nr:putative bisphosphoglycerate-independent phosphoglycerate mutase [Paratrimastix pyriformis]